MKNRLLFAFVAILTAFVSYSCDDDSISDNDSKAKEEAQAKLLLTDGKSWKIGYRYINWDKHKDGDMNNVPEFDGVYTVTVAGDTIVNGRTMKLLRYTTDDNGGWGPSDGCAYEKDGVVYEYGDGKGYDGEEEYKHYHGMLTGAEGFDMDWVEYGKRIIFYDNGSFDRPVLDFSFEDGAANYFQPSSTVSIDTITVKGKKYRRFMTLRDGNKYEPYVEGIGAQSEDCGMLGDYERASDGRRWEFIACYDKDGNCIFDRDDFYAPADK